MNLSEMESNCIDFGEFALEALAEKETAGEIEHEECLEVARKLLEWERSALDLCNLLRARGIELLGTVGSPAGV